MKIVLDIVLNHSCNWGAKGLFEPVNDDSLTPNAQFVDRVQNQMFPSPYYHDYWLSSWDSYDDQSKTIAGDCVDFDTENYVVRDYLIGAYNKFIDMGVDAFRIDTAKHINRYIFNRYFIPAFKARGGDNFYMFGEVCSRVREIWNRGIPSLSPPFFTWKESVDYSGLSDTAAAYQITLITRLLPTSRPATTITCMAIRIILPIFETIRFRRHRLHDALELRECRQRIQRQRQRLLLQRRYLERGLCRFARLRPRCKYPLQRRRSRLG
jgi:hypothetical protein